MLLISGECEKPGENLFCPEENFLFVRRTLLFLSTGIGDNNA